MGKNDREMSLGGGDMKFSQHNHKEMLIIIVEIGDSS